MVREVWPSYAHLIRRFPREAHVDSQLVHDAHCRRDRVAVDHLREREARKAVSKQAKDSGKRAVASFFTSGSLSCSTLSPSIRSTPVSTLPCVLAATATQRCTDEK